MTIKNIFKSLSLIVLSVSLFGAVVPTNAQTGYGTAPLSAKVGQSSNGFSLNDPYECGVGFYGEVQGGTRPYRVRLDIYRASSTSSTPTYTFNNAAISNDGKWTVAIDHINTSSSNYLPSGSYRVVNTVTDLTGASVTATFTANVKKASDCTVLESPIIRNPIGTIRTGAKGLLDANGFAVVIGLLGLVTMSSFVMRLNTVKIER